MADKKARKSSGSEGPSLFARVRAGLPGGENFDGALALGTKVLTGAIIVVLGCSWLFGRAPLERYVASISKEPPKVRVDWPLIEGSKRPTTFVPDSVQADLTQIVKASITPSPFDHDALEEVAERLKSTGWFAKLNSVKREAGGVVTVSGTWRVPAAVVRKDGRNHLVAMDGAILRLPSGVEPPEGLFAITNPGSPPPAAERGGVAYGVPWLGNDVQAAISLLKTLNTRPISRQVAGVDLLEYPHGGKLVLVTDKATRIVWGSAIGESVPGEVQVERKIARLEQNLKDFGRIDANQTMVHIYTPVVLVDKTAREDGGS